MDSPHSFSVNNASHATSVSARLSVEADFDPQLPARVLGRFAEQGRLPASFSARQCAGNTLFVELEFACEPDAARLLSRRLAGVPSVRTVELTLRHRCPPRTAAAAPAALAAT
ncbi:MAG: hypothetical protein ISP90_12300 [Nevskia sp.]|nr:hypothetical protein [Nevskia sp.]